MPFFGLVGGNKKEIFGSGYHRLDMSDITFKISPSKSQRVHYIFVNMSSVTWPVAKERWPDVHGCAVYTEVDDEDPVIVRMFDGPRRIDIGCTLSMTPGQLTVESTISKPLDGENKLTQDKPSRIKIKCPSCGEIINHVGHD